MQTLNPTVINLTVRGLSANYVTHVPAEATDHDIRRYCEEAIRSGEVPGFQPDLSGGGLADHVIDRFVIDGQPRIIVRPRVPFG